MGHDLLLAFRTLRKNPILTAVSLLSLGIGIGANTAIFTLMDRLLLRSLPVRSPGQLVLFVGPGCCSGSVDTWYGSDVSFSWPKYRALADQTSDLFDGIIARAPFTASIASKAQTERARAEMVSGNYFDVLGVRPALGRLIAESDAQVRGASPVAVLSHGYWMRAFGGKPDVLNQGVTVNGHLLTIVGVTQPGFQSVGAGEAPSLFVPATMQVEMRSGSDRLANAHAYWLNLFGRLKPGVTREQAQARIGVVWSRVLAGDIQTLPARNAASRDKYLTRKLELRDGSKGLSAARDGIAGPVYLLMGMVGLVLLIACANVANLLLGRAAARTREMAIRVSLGASRGRLIRHHLAEGALLSLGGGALGLLIASWCTWFMMHLVPEELMAGTSLDPDGRVLLFTLALSVVTGLLFGSIPALRATRPDVAPALREQAISVSSGGHARFRKVLVAGQIAVSILLLATAGLCAHSFYNLRSLNPGFLTDRILAFSIDPLLNGYDAPRSLRLFGDLAQALPAIPGVTAATMAKDALLTDSQDMSVYEIEGYESADGKKVGLNQNRVGPGFFNLLGIPLVKGREFSEGDTAGAPQVAVINETLARKYFDGRDPIGRRLGKSEIVGVSKDAKYDDLREKPKAFVYFAAAQDPSPGPMTFYVRTGIAAQLLTASMRQAVRSLDPNLPVEGPRTLQSQIMQSVFVDRLLATLAGTFAILATLLAAVGLYGVIAWAVTRRRREIGIRMALGARPTDVMGMVLREVLWLAVAGVLVAAPLWIGAARLLSAVLFGVQPGDPWSIGAAVGILTAVAGIAGWIPAHRASRIDPIAAIRQD